MHFTQLPVQTEGALNRFARSDTEPRSAMIPVTDIRKRRRHRLYPNAVLEILLIRWTFFGEYKEWFCEREKKYRYETEQRHPSSLSHDPPFRTIRCVAPGIHQGNILRTSGLK